MKKAKKTRKNLILRLCMIAFVIYAGVQLVDMQMTLGQRRQQLAELQAQSTAQFQTNKDLKRQLSYGEDEDYIERMARDKLEFVAPDERVFIDISGS